jgi:hypothetical protein
MSIVHRKLKPVEHSIEDQALHVYRTPETEISRSECRRPGTRNGNRNRNRNPGCAAPRCPATLPLILNGSEGHHHSWHRRDPAPPLRSGSEKERSNVRGQSLYSINI